jgi:hypothetical protein
LVFMQQVFPQNMECDGIERAAGITLGSLSPVKSVNRLENTERNIENPKNGVRECEGLVCGPGDRLVKRPR